MYSKPLLENSLVSPCYTRTPHTVASCLCDFSLKETHTIERTEPVRVIGGVLTAPLRHRFALGACSGHWDTSVAHDVFGDTSGQTDNLCVLKLFALLSHCKYL